VYHQSIRYLFSNAGKENGKLRKNFSIDLSVSFE
jgi:hypothetical protein